MSTTIIPAMWAGELCAKIVRSDATPGTFSRGPGDHNSGGIVIAADVDPAYPANVEQIEAFAAHMPRPDYIMASRDDGSTVIAVGDISALPAWLRRDDAAAFVERDGIARIAQASATYYADDAQRAALDARGSARMAGMDEDEQEDAAQVAFDLASRPSVLPEMIAEEEDLGLPNY